MEKLTLAMKIVLGTAFTLYLKTHAAHWNVEGPNFPQLHLLFESIYNDVWESVDAIAEQIRQLDAYAPGSLERFAELSRIKSNNEVMPAADMVIMLMKDQEIMMTTLTEAFHAAEAEDRQGLANFCAERLEMHSKWRWQLRATAKRLG